MPHQSRRPVAMFVDDEPDILELYGDCFDWLKAAPYHYEIKCVEDPVEAVQLAAQHRVELLVTDLKMPHMTGIDLFQELRRNEPRLSALLVTGNGNLSVPEIVELTELGFNGIYAKPLNLAALCSKVGILLKPKLALADKGAGIVAGVATNE